MNKDTVHCMHHSLNVFFSQTLYPVYIVSRENGALPTSGRGGGGAHVVNETSLCVLRGHFLKSCKKVRVVTVQLVCLPEIDRRDQ